jgi:hypothetical protein
MRREIRLQRPRRGDEEQHRAVTKYIAGFLMLGRYIQWGNAVLGPHIASMHKWKRVRRHGSERRFSNPRGLVRLHVIILERLPIAQFEPVAKETAARLVGQIITETRSVRSATTSMTDWL